MFAIKIIPERCFSTDDELKVAWSTQDNFCEHNNFCQLYFEEIFNVREKTLKQHSWNRSCLPKLKTSLSILDIFWIYQGSEYASGSKYVRV